MSYSREVVRSDTDGKRNYNEYVKYNNKSGGADRISREVRSGREVRHTTSHSSGSYNKHRTSKR